MWSCLLCFFNPILLPVRHCWLTCLFPQISWRRGWWRQLAEVSFASPAGETAAEGEGEAESKFHSGETKLYWRTGKTEKRPEETETRQKLQPRGVTREKEQIGGSSPSWFGLWSQWGLCEGKNERKGCEEEEEEKVSVRFVRMRNATPKMKNYACYCNVCTAVMLIFITIVDGMFRCHSCSCWCGHNRRTSRFRTKGSRSWWRCSKWNHWRDISSNWFQSSRRIWEKTSTEGTFFYLLLIGSEATALFIDCENDQFVYWQVHRVLPQWLAQPDMIHRDIKSNLVPLADVPEISAKLAKKLLNNGIQHLFPGNINFCSTLLL